MRAIGAALVFGTRSSQSHVTTSETLDMRLLPVLLPTCFAASAILAGTADARPKDSLKVKPDTFIDTAGAFGDPVDPGAASSQWVNKSGTTSTPELFGEPADFGLVLAKNVPTSAVAAALAALVGPEGQTVTDDTVFGYSYREDGHCGAGAPRINVTVTDGADEATYTAGCNSSATPPDSIEDSGDWTAVTWTPANFIPLGPAPVALLDNEIVSVVIVFDEGTDVGPGEAILDDIRFNGLVAGGPATVK
jgi:hypothetical protein